MDDDEIDYVIPCPHCGEEIHDEVEQCPYCRQFILDSDFKKKMPVWMIAIIVFLIVSMISIGVWFR